MDMKQRALEIQDEVVAIRRELHRHPEASFQEFQTTDRIAAELDKMGIPYKRLDPTGLIGTIVCGNPGKTVALRADIDALSTPENSGVSFSSENPGFMHACGHDTHAAMLLGAAKLLNEDKAKLSGTIRLLFQPAEEVARGAKAVLAQDGMKGVDAAFGMHIFAQLPVGSIGISDGVLLPAADLFSIKVKGVASHGAIPDAGVDATIAASAIVMNLQTIVSRELTPLSPAVVTVGKMTSGTRFNIISGEAVMEGTVRMFDQAARRRMPEIIGRIAKETAAAFRCTAELQYDFLTEMLQCDAEVTEIMRGAALKVVGEEGITPFLKSMGGEDFADYTVDTKCAFMSLGGGGTFPQHSDHFVIDEAAFPVGVAMHAQWTEDYLNAAK